MSEPSPLHQESKRKITKASKGKQQKLIQKKNTSKHIATHIESLRQLCEHKESEDVPCQQSSGSDLGYDPISTGEQLSFDQAIQMEYGMLNELQLRITQSYLQQKTCGTIKKELSEFNISISEKSVRTCVLRTLQGFKWEPNMQGGTQTSLSDLDEQYLEGFIRQGLNEGKSLDVGDVRRLAEVLFLGRRASAINIINTSVIPHRKKEKIISSLQQRAPLLEDCWCRSFLTRHNLSLITAEFIEEQRVKYGTSATILRWFTQFESILRSYPSNAIYNMDEMNINFSTSEKIIVSKGTKSFLAKNKPSALPHITACCAFSALGQEMPLMILTKEMKLTPEITQLIDAGIIEIGFSPNGWMSRDYFLIWSKKFVDFVDHTSDPSMPKLLLVDSHNSRESKEALEYLRLHNITVLTYPPHLTHILQPFDVVVARSFKAKFRGLFKKYQKQFSENRTSEKFYVLLLALTAAWKASMNVAVAITSFSITGIYPYNPNMPLSSPYTRFSSDDVEMTNDDGKKLRTSSRILTSDEYLSDIDKRKQLQLIPTSLKASFSTFCKIAKAEPQKHDLVQIRNLLSFNPKKFLDSIDTMIDTEEEFYDTSPVAMFYNAALLNKLDVSKLDERVKKFIHTKTISKETTYKDKVRQALTIAESIIGNKLPDFHMEDAFRKEADRLAEITTNRWHCIVESLEKISEYAINDVYQALWVLARLATGTLESYKSEHYEIPIDPILEFYELRMSLEEDKPLIDDDSSV